MRRSIAEKLFLFVPAGAFTESVGGWSNPMVLGGSDGLYAWADLTNSVARMKSGSAPATETNGLVVSTGD